MVNLNLEKHGLVKKKLNEIIYAISSENTEDSHPEMVYKINGRTLEMIFPNNSSRELAVGN